MPAPPKSTIPRPFFIVSLANFLFFLNFAFFFLLPIWVLEHGGGEEIAGRVSGVSGFAGLVTLPIIGYLLDRFGRRRFMIVGAAASALCSVSFIFVEDINFTLYLLRIVQGIAFTCAFTGAQTLAVLYAPPDRRAEAIGWFGISTILTHAISPALGEQIVLWRGFDAMFAVGTVFGVLGFLMACTLPRPPELAAAGHGLTPDKFDARKAVTTAVLAMVCYGFGFGAVQTFVPVMIERFELGRVGVFFIIWSVAAVLTRIVFGGASDRVGRRAVILPAMLMMSSALAILALSQSRGGVIAAGVVFGFAQGLLYPTMNALIADWSEQRNIGRIQSLFSGSYSLGIASSAFLFGSIAERYGYTALFSATLAITLIGLGIFARGPGDLIVEPHTSES